MSDQRTPDDNPYAPGPIDSPPAFPPTGPDPLEQHGTTRRQDPGSRTARTCAWAVVAVLFPIVVGLQQYQANFAPPPSAAESAEITAPAALDPFTSTAKPMLKLRQFLGEGADERLTGMLAGNLSDAAITPADRVRLAITQWELDQPDEAQKTLDELAEGLEPDDAILPDIEIVTNLLAGEQPETTDAREGFIDRHGWFADLALAHDDKPRHDELLAGGGLMVAIFATIGLGIVSVLVAGLVLLVFGLFRMSAGKMPRRFTPPEPGGSVYIEMLPVFIAGFLMLQIVSGVLMFALGEANGLVATLAMQWLLLGVIAWPLARGVPWSRVRQDLGLVAPNGVLREMGAGVLFYVASMPIYFLVAVIVAFLFFMLELFKSTMQSGGPPPVPPSNPMVDLIGNASPLVLVMFALLAIVWAPIMEELIFRGGVFRHLRSKLHWVPAAFIVALFFGMMHQYHPLQLIPVMTLGFIFAVMREWRGSVIASMTAHFIHNLVVFTILAVVLGIALN